jgi:hypothetical protein
MSFINKIGDLIIDYKYDYISKFKYGVAIISINNKYGLIDTAGKEIVHPVYDKISDINDKIALVKLGDFFGYIDITGKQITPIIYKYALGFNEGVASVSTTNGTLFGLIDTSGKFILPFQFKYPLYFNNGLSPISGMYINKKGKNILNFKAMSERQFNNGVCWIFIYQKGWVLVNNNGVIIRQADSNIVSATKFVNGISKVQKNDQTTEIVNANGVTLGKIDLKTDFINYDISDFENGKAILSDYKKKKSYLINVNGKIVTELPTYISPKLNENGFFVSYPYIMNADGKIYGNFTFK